MKLYLLERKEGCSDSSLGGYDQYEGFVICAVSPERAREMAYRLSGTNAITEEFEEYRAESVWKNEQQTSCMVIGRPSGPITDEQIIMTDYLPG